MVDIIVGEKVINKSKEIGTILSFDDNYIYIDYKTRVGKLLCNAFEQGYLKYINTDLQNKTNESIAQDRIEAERKAEEERVAAQKSLKEQKLAETKKTEVCSDIRFEEVSCRLEPAPVKLNSFNDDTADLIKKIFEECDKSTKTLFDSFKPVMEYPRYTSHSRSKYCVGYLTKHLDTYVFRVFSRNDVYKKRRATGITVMKSDTTEIFRILFIGGKKYSFSKNLCVSDGYFNNVFSYNNWHISTLERGIMLNEIIKCCDCGYLNEYITDNEARINCKQYTKLLFAALHNSKVEIVFKNKAFASTYYIDDIAAYLEEYTPKQIDFASKNDALSTLPVVKRYGILDTDIIKNLEAIMSERSYGYSTYINLEQSFSRLGFDSSDLGKRLINFLKKIDNFNAAVYHDYICELARNRGVTIRDFFDKDYIERHDAMMKEKMVHYNQEDDEKYKQIAKELSWIDREENGYYIMIPKSIAEFKHEGEIQHNCVYTAKYFKQVINRKSIIVFLREIKDLPFVTIEFDYANFAVRQALGKHNSRIDRDLYEYIIKLGKRLNYEMYSHQ